MNAPSNNGIRAEQLAAQFLQQHGLKLLQHNYRCRFGEIDLILQDGETLVFAEVRLRSRNDFGGAAASINNTKQKKLVRAAQYYLSSLANVPACRFDAVLLRSQDGSGIEWLKDAFSC